MGIFSYLLNRSLAHVKRFNNRPQHFPESVAEHSFYVAHFTQIICVLLKEREVKIDQEKAVAMALIHDVEEGFSGDILNPFKHFNEKVASAIREVNEETIGMMFEDLPEKTSQHFIELWYEEQKRQSIESQIVKVADSLSLISKCYEEIEAGNNFFQEIYKIQLRALKNLDYSWWKPIQKEILSGAEKEV
jgi:putative hydrolase of HD superfamily